MTGDQGFELDEDFDVWPGFCRALLGTSRGTIGVLGKRPGREGERREDQRRDR